MQQDLLDHLCNFISTERNQKFDRVIKNRTRHISVAVEDVYQLHNTSAVIRTCDVFGIQDIHIIEERNLKKIDREIAMGAQKWVDLQRFTSSRSCIDHLKTQGFKIVATSPHQSNVSISDLAIADKLCIFFGSEKQGLSQEVINQADSTISIPMVGFTESLNISVSAAIILHELTGRMRSSSIQWELTESEKIQLKLKWISRTLKSYGDLVSRFQQQNKNQDDA